SVCVNVLNTCANTDTTFADSTFSSPSTTGTSSINGKSILVAGRYYVRNTLNLNNCTVYTAAGAQIIVQNGGALTLNNTTIQACDTMWRGMVAQSGAMVYILNQTYIRDAAIGIFAENGTTITLDNSYIYDCVTGLFIPNKTNGYNNIILKVNGSEFKMQSNSLKPDYIGQVPHGATPKVGIEMGMMIATIGNSALNYFGNLNTGIVAKSCHLTVKRSVFNNIAPDLYYNEPYTGTAITSIVETGSEMIASSLTVLPETVGYKTIDNCSRGIYTDRSVLNANYIHLLNVAQGIFGKGTPSQQTSMVNNCTITSSGTGIFWVNNANAKAMIATGNNITINYPSNTGMAKRISGGGIYMAETAFFKPVIYTANNNTITLNQAWYGIMSSATLNSKIKENTIQMNQTIGSTMVTGVELNSTINASVSCNNITGDYVMGTTGTSNGVYATQSIRSNISCNTINDAYRGLFFGGVNPQTLLRGNEMNKHFNGLYLNNVAVIGQQPHRGNRWNGPFTSFGAVNMNFQGFQASTFYVDSLLGSVYNPTVNISGWFKSNSGTTFYCNQQVALCNQSPATMLSLDSLEAMIANGTLETTEYLEETKAISNEYLYRMLVEDSLLMQQDSVYVAFMSENAGNAVAYLSNAEEYLRAASTFDSVYIHIADSATTQMEYYTDSINGIEDWQNLHPLQSADSMQQIWLDKIAFLNQTIHNLETQRQALRENNLANAELENDYVVNAEIPELNTAVINDIEIEYQESGDDATVIANNFTTLLNIAQQCPYSGGHAVMRARVLLSMLTDSIAYDDDGNCLQSGIYRKSKDAAAEVKTTEGIQIIPNPANDKIEIKLNGINDGICRVQIKNMLNEIVYDDVFDSKKQKHTISVSNLSQGVYSLSVNAVGKKSIINKLIIAR
ncbi:MAG TPA: T9SS type A sorting domain-containing protein, partial [Bacteroidia bacterium]|nr:T9SS type A sorting domain-containing protein [Bacteroidia bacterium]